MRDRRYTITRDPTQQRPYTLTYHGEFISSHHTRPQAAAAQERHAEERSARLAGWMQPTLPGGTSQ